MFRYVSAVRHCPRQARAGGPEADPLDMGKVRFPLKPSALVWPANTQQATCSSGGYERLPSSLHVSPRRRIRVGEEGTVLVIVRRNGQNGRVDPTGDRAGRQTLALLPAVHRLVGDLRRDGDLTDAPPPNASSTC